MGRIKRQYYDHAVYHVYNRGNYGLTILPKDEDKRNFLKAVSRYKEKFRFKIYGLVLMDTHYHMVLETNPVHNISKSMQAIQLAYGSQYRKRYKFIGQLWQSRFRSKIISGDAYVLECLTYIHNNPVKTGLVQTAKDYNWSSGKIYENDWMGKLEDVLEVDRYGDTSAVTS